MFLILKWQGAWNVKKKNSDDFLKILMLYVKCLFYDIGIEYMSREDCIKKKCILFDTSIRDCWLWSNYSVKIKCAYIDWQIDLKDIDR